GDTATDDLLHLGRIDAGPLDHLDLGSGEDVGGVHTRQHAVALADRGARRLDDHGLAHLVVSSRWPAGLVQVIGICSSLWPLAGPGWPGRPARRQCWPGRPAR